MVPAGRLRGADPVERVGARQPGGADGAHLALARGIVDDARVVPSLRRQHQRGDDIVRGPVGEVAQARHGALEDDAIRGVPARPLTRGGELRPAGGVLPRLPRRQGPAAQRSRPVLLRAGRDGACDLGSGLEASGRERRREYACGAGGETGERDGGSTGHQIGIPKSGPAHPPTRHGPRPPVKAAYTSSRASRCAAVRSGSALTAATTAGSGSSEVEESGSCRGRPACS